MDLNLEKFNPTKAEIATLVADAKGLTIKGIDDKEGYQKVHETRIALKNARVAIQKTGKVLRQDAIDFQRKVIEKEKELVSLIEPTEVELEEKQKFIDGEKEKAKRRELLPDRVAKLKEIDVVVEEEFLLVMDDTQFDTFFNQQHSLFLQAKERKIKEEQEKAEAERLRKEKIERDKLEAEQAKVREAEAKVEAEKRKLEQQKEAEKQEKKRQAELEQARKDEAARVEREAKDKAKHEAEEKKRKEAELKKQKAYQDFLKKNGYTEAKKKNFYILDEGNKVTLFKKVDEFIK